jgi:sulfite reductase (NADPH) flavoprotein alpha-component
MLRRLHSLPGLALALMLAVTAVSGAALSLVPAVDRASQPTIPPGQSVGGLAASVAARHQAVDKIVVRPSGAVTVAYTDGEASGIEVVDPATGNSLGLWQPSGTTRWLTNLHRSFLADDTGRIAAAVSAAGMMLLALSGAILLWRRAGSLRAFLGPVRGTASQRWHGELGRVAAMGLLLSALTGLWMSAGTFGLLSERQPQQPTVQSAEGRPAPVAALAGLRAVGLADLKELAFPAADDPADVYRLRTAAGEASIDRVSGRVIAFSPASAWEKISGVVVMLHTGRGAWVLGLLLGLCAASVPAFGVTGAVIWWRRRVRRGSAPVQAPAEAADTVILVGSEGQSTWGFAATLHAALAKSGCRVHTAAMNDVSPAHLQAGRLLILAATAGDGSAPSSADAFLPRLGALNTRVPVAVLGFGDRTFPQFCRFAQTVSETLARDDWPMLLPPKRVDRQSAQEFAEWGRDLGAALGCELVLEHRGATPATASLELVGRQDYGAEVGAPVAILRFAAAAQGRRSGRLPAFEAGDLAGIVPPGGGMPRFYSLASASRDGALEICVRLRPGGVCSTYLHGLAPGGRIDVFIRENPRFRPAEGRVPLILIGAGAGVGPLAGFVRGNTEGRPVHLYFGGRSPASDFLYEHEFAHHLSERRLTSLRTAFSRTSEPSYVQDRLAADAPHLRELIRHGAQVLVCGGREMAQAVSHTLERVLHPLGTDLATLKSAGRYLEDVY